MAFKGLRFTKKRGNPKKGKVDDVQKDDSSVKNSTIIEAVSEEHHVDSPRVAARKLLLSIMADCERGGDDDSFDEAPDFCDDDEITSLVAKNEVASERTTRAGKSLNADKMKALQLQMNEDDDDDASEKRTIDVRDDSPARSICSSQDNKVEKPDLAKSIDDNKTDLLPHDGSAASTSNRKHEGSSSNNGDLIASLSDMKASEVMAVEDEEHDTPAEKEIYDMTWFSRVEKDLKTSLSQETTNTYDKTWFSKVEKELRKTLSQSAGLDMVVTENEQQQQQQKQIVVSNMDKMEGAGDDGSFNAAHNLNDSSCCSCDGDGNEKTIESISSAEMGYEPTMTSSSSSSSSTDSIESEEKNDNEEEEENDSSSPTGKDIMVVPTGSDLSPKVHDFLDRLQQELDSRNKKDAEIGYPEYRDSDGMKAGSSGHSFNGNKSMYQQQTLDGDLVATLDELYVAAEIAKPIYEKTISRVIDQVCGDDRDSVIAKFADLKDRDRAQEKAGNEYVDRSHGPALSWLYDIVRGSILFSSAEQMMKCIELLQQDPSVHVVNIYNKFKNLSLNGYRLLNLHIKIDTQQGFEHICEIQIHHLDINTLDLASVDDTILDELLETKMDLEQLQRLAEMFCHQLCAFDWAHRVCVKLLKIQWTKLGFEHLDVAKTCMDIGSILHEYRGLPKEAIEMYTKALKIQVKKLGEEHTLVAATYVEIGNALYTQGEKKEALESYEKSVKILEKQDKQPYMWVDTAQKDITDLLSVQGKVEQALATYSKSLEIYKLTVEDGLSILHQTFAELGKIVSSQEQLEEVLEINNHSLEVCKKTLDATNIYPGNMGNVMCEQGKMDEAFEIYAKSLINSHHLQQQPLNPAA
jgi:tetratricopeptide (TPR) repeat protein